MQLVIIEIDVLVRERETTEKNLGKAEKSEELIEVLLSCSAQRRDISCRNSAEHPW